MYNFSHSDISEIRVSLSLELLPPRYWPLTHIRTADRVILFGRKKPSKKYCSTNTPDGTENAIVWKIEFTVNLSLKIDSEELDSR